MIPVWARSCACLFSVFLWSGSANAEEDGVPPAETNATDLHTVDATGSTREYMPGVDPSLDAYQETDLYGEGAEGGHEGPEEKYDRFFPVGAQEAIDRGYSLPLPFGLSLMYVHNTAQEAARDLAVSLSKGRGDPPEQLFEVPFVTVEDLSSKTESGQARMDVWVLPFLDLFASLGKVEGHVDVSVDVDLDAALPPIICRPARPCGTRRLNFLADVDNKTTTFGMLLIYGYREWWAAGALARTISVSLKDRSDINSVNASVRLGRRWRLGQVATLSPYVGANYFNMHTTVTGIVRAEDAFEDGDDLALRYSININNRNDWSGILGFNLGFTNHLGLQSEYDWSGKGDRVIVSTYYRF